MVEEVPLSIFINGRHFVTAMTSPEMRTEFVTGHLFAERIISGPQEIESLEIEGNVARAIVSHPMRAIVPRRPIVSGCGGIASFLDESKLPEIKSDLRIGKEAGSGGDEGHLPLRDAHSHGRSAFRGPLRGKEGRSASSRTSAGTMPWIRPSAMRSCQKQDSSFGRTFVACTGRVSSDMALKCSVAGIPIIVSRGATTSLAISIAERTGLCIIGFLRGKRLSVYTNRERFKID